MPFAGLQVERHPVQAKGDSATIRDGNTGIGIAGEAGEAFVIVNRVGLVSSSQEASVSVGFLLGSAAVFVASGLVAAGPGFVDDELAARA